MMEANEFGTYKPGNNTDLINKSFPLNSSENGDYEPPNETLYRVLTWCVYTTVFVAGSIGNILVLLSIHRCRQLKGVPAMLLVSLAVADFLVCFFIVPIEIYQYYATEFHLGPFVCKLITFLNQLLIACSSFTLALISVERFYVVKYPLKARAVITTRRARIVIVGIWLASAICAVPNTYRQEHVRYEWDIYRWAQCVPSETNPWMKVNAMFDYLVKYALPVLSMAVCYTIVIITLYKSTRQSKRLQSIKMGDNKLISKSASTNGEMAELTKKTVKQKATKTKAERQQADRNQAILMLSVVVLLYFISWGPFMTLQVLWRFDVVDAYTEGHMRLTYTLLKMLGIMNSCLNPFLYVFMSKSFRSAIKTTVCCSKSSDLSTSANIGRSTSGGLNSKTVTSRYSISEMSENRIRP